MQYIHVHVINRTLSRKLQRNTTTYISFDKNPDLSRQSEAHSIIHLQTLETLVRIKLGALMFASAFRR
jgi:hypothetical protein